MEDKKRKKGGLIASLICLGLALALLVPTLILLSGDFMVGVIAFGGVGVILLIVYFFEKWAKLIIGILFTTLFAIFLICTFVATDVFIWFAVPCFVVGFSLLFDCLMKKIGSQLTLPILADVFSFSFLLMWLLGEIINYSQISTLFFIMAVLFPIVGIILGIIALSSGMESENQRRICLGLSISAIAFPILVVIVLILLLSTGVLVISLM
ncbi:MAG: hypothetical protein J1F33_03100 [Clostridiales bacterium]|nr:hypothetical protein [Clostridiales bacterium]